MNRPLDVLVEVMRAVETFCSHGVPESQCPMPIGCVEYGYPDYPALACACLRAIGEGKVLNRKMLELVLASVCIGVGPTDGDAYRAATYRELADAILHAFREAGGDARRD